MNKSLRAACSALFVTAFAAGMCSAKAEVITFEDVAIGSEGFVNNYSPTNSFDSGAATFNNLYNTDFSSWSQFAPSKVINIETAGFSNQYAVYAPERALGAGAGLTGSLKYGIGYASAYDPAPRISFNFDQQPLTLEIANTTYAALSMLNGDGYAKKFGGLSGNDEDFYRLTISGFDALNAPTGSLVVYLADYRFANNALDYVLSDWTHVDVSGFDPSTRALQFAVESSDNHPTFGIKTPSYFAVDNITTVPEPTTAALFALASLGLAVRRKRA